VFDIDNTARTALVARLTGASFRAVLFLENVRRHLPGWYTHSALVQSADYEKQSIVDSQLSLLATAEVPVTTREFRLVPWKEDLESADRLLGGGAAQHGVRRLLVHPGTRSRHRLWPVERFAAVCDRLQDDLGAQVFLVAGPGEQDLVSAIRDKAQSHIVALNAPLEIGAFAALASRFDAMLCHDSGPMHVAAAVGTPVVALFGSQNAAVWGPVGPRHVVLRPPLPCTACPTPDVCVPGDSYNNHCVRNIPADRAFDALRQVLSAK
jgi:ADP-heptose:LPS heptosyltransferase